MKVLDRGLQRSSIITIVIQTVQKANKTAELMESKTGYPEMIEIFFIFTHPMNVVLEYTYQPKRKTEN